MAEIDRLRTLRNELVCAINRALPVLKDEQRVREESYLPNPTEQEQVWLAEIGEAIDGMEAVIQKARVP